jgi:hypothetical protein
MCNEQLLSTHAHVLGAKTVHVNTPSRAKIVVRDESDPIVVGILMTLKEITNSCEAECERIFSKLLISHSCATIY